jgi:hypothetical protein
VLELDRYCREHGLLGADSEHGAPYLPHRVTIYTAAGQLLETAGWTSEHAAIAALRRLHA